MATKSTHGGARKGAGRKKVGKVEHPNAARVQDVAQRGYDQLDAIFDLMLERAKGVKIAVRPLKRGKNSMGEIVWLTESAPPHKCDKCGHVCEYQDTEVLLVYQEPPNDQQLQFLYNHLAGRAAAKAQEVVIPEINVIFNTDIQCDPSSPTPEIPTRDEEPCPEEPIQGPGRPTLGLNLG